MMPTEKQRMLSGDLYFAYDPELVADRLRARKLLHAYNATGPEAMAERRALLQELFGALGERFEIEPPFFCDYGCNIRAGDNLYLNAGCVILDCAAVDIGANVLIGPGVHIYAATHPTDPVVRRTGRELAAPVSIGDDVWIGGGAILCPGVSIGDGTTIAAGSVVVRDVPAGVVVAGNPGRVIRPAVPATRSSG